MNIVEKNWQWPRALGQRGSTDYLVVHHTAGPQMQDTDQIWQEHINQGYNGIGYHYVIKGDGTTVRGRPRDTVGAQALGINYCSIGICLEGNFEPGYANYCRPTDAQISSLKQLLGELKSIYPDVQIIGHRDVSGITGNPDHATACPGQTLYDMLPAIIAEAEA